MRPALSFALIFAIAPAAFGQGGAAERVGKSLDNAGKSIRRGVENAVGSVRSGVEQKELQTRAYFRIYWDQALHRSAIQVSVRENGTVVLRGSVVDDAAKQRAVDLAQTTLGVTAVVDELVSIESKPDVAPPAVAPSGSTTKPGRKIVIEPAEETP